MHILDVLHVLHYNQKYYPINITVLHILTKVLNWYKHFFFYQVSSNLNTIISN